MITYPERGATEHGPLPPGYRHLRYETLLGHGPGVRRAAAEAVLTWRMHRATGARVVADGRAAPGVRVTVSFGPLSAPCEVVWADENGFGYGTLPGHPATGEEAFVIEQRGADVWLTITAFSRPAGLLMRLAGPVAPLLQRAYVHRCGAVLRGLVKE